MTTDTATPGGAAPESEASGSSATATAAVVGAGTAIGELLVRIRATPAHTGRGAEKATETGDEQSLTAAFFDEVVTALQRHAGTLPDGPMTGAYRLYLDRLTQVHADPPQCTPREFAQAAALLAVELRLAGTPEEAAGSNTAPAQGKTHGRA